MGVIASAVLHVGGLFLLLSARAPQPLIPLGTDTRVAVDIISVDEYNAIVSRAPASSTLAGLRTQPEPPRAPVLADESLVADTALDTPPESPAPAVELAMRLPPPVDDVPPAAEEPPESQEPEVAVAPMPEPLALDEAALQDRGVDPADLGPPEDVQVAIAPPTPKPPRGAMDAMPQIDTSPDEPPAPPEPEGEGQEAVPAPEPQPAPEPVEVAEADDPAPMATPLPVPKPRGSLAMASDAERARAPAQVAEATPEPAPPVETPPPPPAPVETPEEPVSQLSEAELEEERRLMAALMEQMRAAQPPSDADLRAAEEEARRAFEEEQRRLAELAALDEEERRAREAEDREREAAEQRALELERQARELAARREREAQQQALAEQEAARREAALREQEARRLADIEAQRRAQQELDAQRRAAAQAEQEARDLAARRQQLAALDTNIETRAGAVLDNVAPAPAPQGSFPSGQSSLDRIFAAANTAASSANTGSNFSQGAARAGASLTAGETQAVLDQLRRCWRVDTFSANARNSVVTFRATLRQNGFVDQGSIALLSPNPPPPEFQVAVDRARTALQDVRCQPFALPPQKYNAWRDITITFDPAQMVLQ